MKKTSKKNPKKKTTLVVVNQTVIATLAGQDGPKFAEEIYPDVLMESFRAIISTLEEKDS